MKQVIDIEAMKKMAEVQKQTVLRMVESWLLLCESIKVLEGEQNDAKNKTGREANTSVPSEWTTVYPEGDGSVPHEGVSSRMGGVRKGRRGVEKTHDGGDEAEAHPLEVKVVMPKQKPLKIPKRDEQRVCEICGKAFTWGESGFRKTCSEECEKERKRRMAVARANRRRMETASVWETPPPRKPSKLDKKLKALEAEGTTYAEKQKADTIEKFAKIDLTGRIE